MSHSVHRNLRAREWRKDSGLKNAAYLLNFLDLGRQLHLGWPAVRLGASCYLSETARVARTRNDASRSYVPNLEGDRDLLTIVTGSNNECL